ncbi:MAG: hypothetical protein AAF223_20350 [Bacteroidota bacterium]
MSYSSDKSFHVGGSISGSFINTGIANDNHINFTDNSGSQTMGSEKKQLRQDLKKLEALLKQLEESNPQASSADKQTVLTAGTPKPVRDRLVAATLSGGKAAISEFLDNAYVNIVVAIIDGWRS